MPSFSSPGQRRKKGQEPLVTGNISTCSGDENILFQIFYPSMATFRKCSLSISCEYVTEITRKSQGGKNISLHLLSRLLLLLNPDRRELHFLPLLERRSSTLLRLVLGLASRARERNHRFSLFHVVVATLTQRTVHFLVYGL